MERIPILKEMIEKGQIGIVGGTHDFKTGHVTFYPETMSLDLQRKTNKL